MTFATLKYRDVFSLLNAGFPPNLYTSTTASGSPLKFSPGIGKMVFELQVGSGAAAGQAQLLLYGCSASTGTGMTLLGTQSNYPTILASVASATPQIAVMELRGEYIESNSTGPWVIPLFSGSGASSYYMAVTAKAYQRSFLPASNYDSGSYVTGEIDLF